MVSALSFDPEQPPNISHYPEKYEVFTLTAFCLQFIPRSILK